MPFKYEVIQLKQHWTEWLICTSWILFCDVGAHGWVLSISSWSFFFYSLVQFCSLSVRPLGSRESFKKPGQPVKRLNSPCLLRLHFLEGFPVPVGYGFAAVKDALQTRCPAPARLMHACRAGHTGQLRAYWWEGGCLVLCHVSVFRNFGWLYPLSPFFSWWCGLATEPWQQVTEEQETMLSNLLPVVLVTSAEQTGVNIIKLKHTLCLTVYCLSFQPFFF